MDTTNPLRRAAQLVGLGKLAGFLGVTYQAVLKWEKARRLPRTEWTGETAYAQRIQELTGGEVTRDQLLAPWPEPPAAGAASGVPSPTTEDHHGPAQL